MKVKYNRTKKRAEWPVFPGERNACYNAFSSASRCA